MFVFEAGSHSVALPDLEFTIQRRLASASRVLGEQAYATISCEGISIQPFHLQVAVLGYLQFLSRT